MAFEFTLIGLACIEQKQGVAGGCCIEHDEAILALTDLPCEGTKDSDFFRTWRAQVFLKQCAACFVHRCTLSLHDFALIGGGLRSRIDFAECEAIHLASQSLCHMRGGISGAEMHGMTSPC